MQITIVTVTYNSSNTILNFLKSLEKSKKIELIREVIIIENNSPEKLQTIKNIEGFRITSKLKINTILSKKNNGFAKSCNYGAKIARSNYILFINPDTEVYTNSIPTLVEHTLKNNADISGGKSINYKGVRHLTVVRKPNLIIGLFEFSNLGKIFNTQIGHNHFYYLDSSSVLKDKQDVVVDAIGGAYLLVRKKSFNDLSGFDEKFFMYLEDVDLSVRAKEMNFKIMYCPHSIIKHIGGASSTNQYRIRHSAWFSSRKYYYRKHHNFFINLIIQPLYIIEEMLLKKFKHL